MTTKLMLEEDVMAGSFIIKNDRGLHTRPSTEIVKLTAQFDADIRLIYQKLEVNAKSILGVLMLAARRGARIRVVAKGNDAKAALEALITLAKNQFNIKY